MRQISKLMLVPAVLLAAACGRGNDDALDEALRRDLMLAASMQPQMPIVSPYEQGYYQQGYQQPGYMYPTPVRQSGPYMAPAPAPAPQRTTTTVVRPAPRAEPIRNTKRDAIIGASAGAVIGAVTSKDRLKGAVIGAAAGGVLGGIIGHTVDIKKPF